MRQNEGETLEEFGQRVYFTALDGYHGERDSTVDKIGVEHFLRGIRDKYAAERAFDKAPKTIPKAMKYVKKAIATHRAIYGGAKTSNSLVRCSSYEDPITESHDVRLAFSQSSNGQFRPKAPPAKPFMQSVGTSMTPPSSPGYPRRSFSNERRSYSRSPARSSGSGECYGCGEKGHFAREGPKRPSSPSPRHNLNA